MKYLMYVWALTPMISWAQICAPNSPEMAVYQNQKKWAQAQLDDGTIPGKVVGLIDEKNGFHYYDLTRSGQFEAKVIVDSKNESFEDFFSYCGKAESKGRYLHLMRQNGENNRYTVKLRYLPEFKGTNGSVYKKQNLNEHHTALKLKIAPDSVSATQEFRFDEYQKKIYRHLQSQLENQKEVGVLELDLTNFDDFACDLIQGKATISVEKISTSNAPLVEQKQVVDPKDLSTIYSSLRERISKSKSKEELLFKAGRTLAQLEQNRLIASYGDEKVFTIAKKLLSPDFGKVADLVGPQLQCVVDQLQDYDLPLLQHFFDIQFKFSPLAVVQAESGGL